MVQVLCPVCNEIVEGMGEVDLSLNLQAHMHKVHGFNNLCKLEGEGYSPLRTEPWYEVRKEDLSTLPYEQEAIAEWHGPAEERLPGEDVPQAVRCPFCGEVVRGYAFDDFSYNLAMHVRTIHDVKVKLMGKG